MFDHIKKFLFAASIWDGRRRGQFGPTADKGVINESVAGFAAGLLALVVLGGLSAAGATNEWTKPSSGYWEESYWSLGRLPADQDTVVFRNSNWKALAIGANTTSNYPSSLLVNNLLVEAPTYSFNQLLLNWAGFTVPLNVRSNLTIGVNGSLASHYSALHAANVEINGPTSFSDSAVGVFNQIVVGRLAAAELDLQDGSISCGRFVLGSGAPGTYKQSSGTLNTTNIEIGGSATFKLLGGAISNAGLFTIRGPSSVFVAVAASQRLGNLQLTNTPASGSLDLESDSGSNGPALLRFEDSRNIGWSGALQILNWSTNHLGHGPDHIFVGTNSQGLTFDQLTRVTFVQPNGSPFNYWATISSNGEVVPGLVHGQDFAYITNNGTILITGYNGPGGDVLIPNVITGLPVTGIAPDAFYNCTRMVTITIPSSVTTIGAAAFEYCTSLTGITIPDSVTTVGVDAFSECTSLTTVVLGAGLTYIANGMFSYCASLTHVTVPGSVVSIGDFAFAFCTSLTGITIPNSVTSIGNEAFYVCTSLTSVAIPSSVTTIGDSVFYYCTSLTDVTLPNSITSIGPWSFYRCTNLTSVTIPTGVTSIGPYAFFGCNSLLSVIIPKNVVTIGDAAFSACKGLSAITVAPDNTFYGSVDGVLFNKSQTTLISFPAAKAGAYTIPNTVTSIGIAAFFDCSNLTTITIPTSVTSIGSEAFSNCTGLLGITLPNSISAIADVTFSGCTNLANVTVPNSVTSIGNSAFWGCTSLTNVTLGSSVTNIGSYAFLYCFSLIAITVDPGNSHYSSVNGVLFDKAQTILLLCPPGKPGSYTIPNSVTAIADSAFYYCTRLTGMTLPNSLTNIGYNAFSYCTNLAGVTIPNSVATIGDRAFQNCTGLTNVIIGSGITTIPSGAFAGCVSLTGITIPNGVTTIGSEAFSECTSLTSIAIPNSVTTIGLAAFDDCTSLTSVTIPNSVTSIGYRAFSSCSNLTAVYFAGNAPGVQNDVFSDASPTIYYLPGATGWGPTFAGRPTALWLPKVDTSTPTFGVRTNRFGFTISWAGQRTVIVEASTNLADGVWLPLSTNTLVDGSFYFNDRQSTNYRARFYRLHAP